jgi:hypothetical protein
MTKPRGLDSILLTDSSRARHGLYNMLTAAIGEHTYDPDLPYVDVPFALLVIEAAKLAEDRSEWFPRGKWDTIHVMQKRVNRELQRMFRGENE